ncbi:hypothetical protein HA402_004300 [Bradysia odoriphaga]|nr:hypothetical protein HA402_004300 [Bradysia odoriphaga]
MKKHKKKQKKGKETDDQLCNEERQDSTLVSVKMVRNGVPINELNLLEIASSTDEVELYILDEPFAVTFNVPWISSIMLPSSILASCYVYPSQMDMQCCNSDETLFEWYRGKQIGNETEDRISWTHISDAPIYLAQPSDVGHKLKVVCTPRNGSKTGPKAECVSSCAVEAAPGVCLFEPRHLYTQQRLPNHQFRVVTYNLLADLYANSDYSRTILFPYCPAYALAIDYRKQLFIKEIQGYNGDIVCLQEVDSKIFYFDLLPFLRLSDYVGTFKPKGLTAEGLAIFFNSKKFSLIRNDGINIGENIPTLDIFNDLWLKIKDNEALVSRITDRSTAVQVTSVQALDSRKIVIVANTHLYFRPDADHIRLLQIAFCMKYVESIYHQIKLEFNVDDNDISIVFCGDFNSVPECGIFKLMTQQKIEENFVDFQSNREEAVRDVSLSQPFQFKSAYVDLPKYTNYTVGFAACLDYIFYQPTNLRVIQTIPVPSEEELQAHTAIPCVVYPSDHISLVADLEWIEK